MSTETKHTPGPWTTREGSYKKTLQYLVGRMKGEITSILTPWSKINAIGANGFEMHTSIAFCSRPSVGKSLLLEQFCNEVYKLNPDKKIRVLKLQLEMMDQIVDIREFSSILGKSYGYMVSTEEHPTTDDWGQVIGKEKLSIEDLKKCWEYVKTKIVKDEHGEQKFPENVIHTAPTVEELEKIIDDYMESYKIGTDNKGNSIYTETVIAIDHARLIRRKGGQSETDMLYELGPMLNRKKREYPIIIILLNHLKREINSDLRCENGKYGNYIRDEDVFGGDSIFQNFDIIVGMDRPSLRQISRYGPSNYLIEDEYTLVFHFLKVRNGSPGISFFRGEYSKMKITEIPTPPKAATKAAEYRHQNSPEQRNSQTKANLQ